MDLAAEMGGNCELTSPGETVVREGVTIHGDVNLPSTVAVHASQLYARNVGALLGLLVKNGTLALDLEDEDARAAAIQSAASEALAEGRWYRPERREWWPHMTLARVKRGRRAEPLDPAEPLPGPLLAPLVTLYRSTLRPQGAVYTPLDRVELRSV